MNTSHSRVFSDPCSLFPVFRPTPTPPTPLGDDNFPEKSCNTQGMNNIRNHDVNQSVTSNPRFWPLYRAFSLHLLTLRAHRRWLFLEEKATLLQGFCIHQKRKCCSPKCRVFVACRNTAEEELCAHQIGKFRVFRFSRDRPGSPRVRPRAARSCSAPGSSTAARPFASRRPAARAWNNSQAAERP